MAGGHVGRNRRLLEVGTDRKRNGVSQKDNTSELYPLQSAFDEAVRAAPRLILERLLDEKLASVVPERRRPPLVKALVEHVCNCANAPFEWDDGGPDLNIDLTMSEADSARFDALANELFARLPEMVDQISDETSAEISKSLRRRWPAESRSQKRDENAFRKRLDQRWGKAFSAFRMLLTMCREVGFGIAERVHPAETEMLRSVLLRLHARGCQIGCEILTLMENGYADGAMARWRTLYEVGVVAALIADWGDKAARAYLDHEIVESKLAMEAYERCAPAIGFEPIDAGERASVMAKYVAMLDRYGKDFGSQYGWAGLFCANKRPNFTDLEAFAQTAELRSFYKMASYNVHAGVKGIIFKLGVVGRDVMLAGASNAGFADPCDRAARDLVSLTAHLLFGDMKFDEIVNLKCMVRVRDLCIEEAMAAHDKLEEDEEKLAGYSD